MSWVAPAKSIRGGLILHLQARLHTVTSQWISSARKYAAPRCHTACINSTVSDIHDLSIGKALDALWHLDTAPTLDAIVDAVRAGS